MAGRSLGLEEWGDLPRIWLPLLGAGHRQGCHPCRKAPHILCCSLGRRVSPGPLPIPLPQIQPPLSPSSMLSCLCGLPGLPTRAGWSCPCPCAIAATRTQMAPSLGVLWALRQPWRHPVSPCQTQAPRAGGLSRQAGVAREGDSPDSPGEGSREEQGVEDRDIDGGGLQGWAGRASLGVTQRLLACFPGWGAQRGRVSPRLQ